MKKIVIICCILSMLTGCYSNTSTNVIEIEPEYIDIDPPKYNTDKPLKKLTFTQSILGNGYSLIQLINKSNNCYKDIEYSVSGVNSHFEYVAGNSTVYDLIHTDEKGEVEVVNYELSAVAFFDATDYVEVKRVFDIENHTLGTLQFKNIDYDIYTKFFVLYNHYYIGSCYMKYDYIPDYTEIKDYTIESAPGYEIDQPYTIDFTTIYMNVDSDGYLILENSDTKVEYNQLGRCELYPEYINMAKSDFR